MSDGTFVAFEGVDATGKTELVERVATALSDDRDVVTVGEFSESRTGDELRSLLVEGNVLDFEYGTLSLVSKIVADHFYQVEHEILPRVEDGSVVLKDRFVDTIPIYELRHLTEACGDEQVARDFFEAVETLTPVAPDVTIYLRVPEESLHRRIARRSTPLTEEEKRVFRRRQRRYRQRAVRHPDRSLVYTNDVSPSTAAEELAEVVREKSS